MSEELVARFVEHVKDQISLHKIKRMVDALGARLEDQRQEEITNTMVVCIDAGKAPTKGNERIDDDKRRRYDREFRDVKVASVSALEWDEGDQETHCSNSSYVLGIEHADEFFQRIWVEMNRRSHDLSTTDWKQSGMTWTLAGAKHMLQIRASLMSSRFARDFQHVPSSRSYRLPREPAIHSLGSHRSHPGVVDFCRRPYRIGWLARSMP